MDEDNINFNNVTTTDNEGDATIIDMYPDSEEAAKKVADGESQNLRPVESVKWFNAIVFCNELTKKNFGCR